MAYTVESRTNNLATQLREALDKAERLVVQIDGQTAEPFLQLLDQIERWMEQLAQEGIDLRGEEVRWQSLLNRLDSKPAPIVKAAAAAGGLAELRRRNPPAESFWWRLDSLLAERRNRALRRSVIGVLAVVVAVIALYWGINRLFPPNPQAVAMVEATNTIGRLVAEQRWEEALATVQAARQNLPDEPELAMWEVVLYERLGNADAAAATLAEAQQTFAADPVQLWIYLGNNRMMAGDLDGAEAAARAGEAIAPNDPMLAFLQGSIAEVRGQTALAIDYFSRASELAGDDNPQLSAIARVRMGYLLGSAGAFTSPAPTPTPTPE